MENIVQCNIEKGDIMAHKTFISYKWSEAQQLRDDIIDALGEDIVAQLSRQKSKIFIMN